MSDAEFSDLAGVGSDVVAPKFIPSRTPDMGEMDNEVDVAKGCLEVRFVEDIAADEFYDDRSEWRLAPPPVRAP